MPVINYTGQNTQKFICDNGKKFTFLPGANEVPPDVWADLEQNDSVKAFMARGKLVPVVTKVSKPVEPVGPAKLQKVGAGAPTEDAELDSLSKANVAIMDAWSAITLIEGVIDLDHLRRFVDQESERKGGGRKTVKAALTAQIEAMEATEPEKE